MNSGVVIKNQTQYSHIKDKLFFKAAVMNIKIVMYCQNK